jgi:hypothetical protein
MRDVLIVVSACAGTLLFYFSTPAQRWLHAPWPARPARIAACVCIVASFVCGTQALHPATSLSFVVTMIMVCLTAYPFVGVLVERVRARGAAR